MNENGKGIIKKPISLIKKFFNWLEKKNSISVKKLAASFVFTVVLMLVFTFCDFEIANSIIITFGFDFFLVKCILNPKYADQKTLIKAKVEKYNNNNKSEDKKIKFNEDFFDRQSSIIELILFWLIVLPVILPIIIINADDDKKIIKLINLLTLCEYNLLNLVDQRMVWWAGCSFFFCILLIVDPFKMMKIPREIHLKRIEEYGTNLNENKSKKNKQITKNIKIRKEYRFEIYFIPDEEHKKIREEFGKLSVYIGDYDDEEIKIMEECLNYNTEYNKENNTENKKISKRG